MEVINVKNLTKDYVILDRPRDVFRLVRTFGRGRRLKCHRALDNISFRVEKGEVLGLIGANGSGKSTMLKMLSGVSTPTGGRVDVHGRISAILEVSTGFSEELSGRENIRRRLAIQGLTRREIKRLLPEIIEFSELEDVIDEPVRTYSAGMGAKLAFSVVTAAVNDVVLLDEIMAVGDEHFHSKSYRRIREICSSGRTVVVASHDIAFVDRLCHQAVWLERGRVRQQGDAHVVSMAYGGKDSEKIQASYHREFGQIELVRVDIVGGKMRVTSHIRVHKPTHNLQYQVTVFDNRLGIISTMMETAWSGVPVPGEVGLARLTAEFEIAGGLGRGLVGTALRHATDGASPVVQDAWGWDNAKQVYFRNPGWTDGRGYIRKPFKWTRCS